MLRERKSKVDKYKRRKKILTKAQKQQVVWLRCQGETQQKIANKLGYSYQAIHEMVNSDKEYLEMEKSILDESRERVIKRFSFLILKAMKRHQQLLNTKDDELALKAIDLIYKVNSKLFENIDAWEIRASKVDKDAIKNDVNPDWTYMMDHDDAKRLMDKVNGKS